MKRWINCAQCRQPLAAAMVETNGNPFCSGACEQAFAEQAKRQGREETARRDAALERLAPRIGSEERLAPRIGSEERQADQAGARRMGGILLALIVAALLHGCDSPKDLLGPDERAHMAAGRLALR